MAARYYLELFNFCNRYVRDRAVAQDIVQEVYARLAAFDQQASRPVIDLRAHESDDVLLDMPAPASDNPEAAYAASQRVRLLVAAIESLPPRCREAFVMHRIEGLPQAEVAARMGISRNMVERHIMIAVAACRKRLRDAAGAAQPAPARPEEV